MRTNISFTNKLLKKILVSTTLLLTALLMFAGQIAYAMSAEEMRLNNYRLPWLSYTQSTCTATGTSTGLDGFVKALALHESGGNPQAQAAGSTASGKYQYIDGTWQGRKSIYGPAAQYSRAKDAPEPVQDAVAYIEYAQKFDQLEGNVEKLAMSHFYPALLNNPERWGEQAPGNNGGMTYRDYIEKMTSKIGTPEAEAIPLRYAEAPDFQTWLAKAGVNGGTSSTSSSGCTSGVPAGDFVFYLQSDPKWKDHPFGNHTIGPAGCGPSSLAMVVATLKDKSVTPVTVADWATQNNHYSPGGGSQWSLFTAGPANWGLKSQTLFTENAGSRPSSADMDAAIQVIKSGGLVIASGTGPIPFTTAGHIIVLRGVTDDGKILLGDPGHNGGGGAYPDPNKTAYTPSELSPYIRGLWGITK